MLQIEIVKDDEVRTTVQSVGGGGGGGNRRSMQYSQGSWLHTIKQVHNYFVTGEDE